MGFKRSLVAVTLGLCLVVVLLWVFGLPTDSRQVCADWPVDSVNIQSKVNVLVDDFRPQPITGNSVWYYNRIGGDRGALGSSEGSVELDWGQGQVTATVLSGGWGGVWMSLNHPLSETKPLNLSRVLPPQVGDPYQSEITGLTLEVARGTPGAQFRIELKDESTANSKVRWEAKTVLNGGQQVLSYALEGVTDTTTLLWLLDGAQHKDYVVVENVSLTATTQITDPAWAGFVWSYGMLLNAWNPKTGLVRDKSKEPSGEFDAIQSTGSLAAATVVAEQLGVISRDDALDIVTTISDTLLSDIPRHSLTGLWPHWVQLSPSGTYTIVQNTEWSSVDTAIAAVGLLEAQNALGLYTLGTEQMLEDIQWGSLVLTNGISHGYTYGDKLIPYPWDAFGGESWLMGLVYAAATDKVAPIKYGRPPTANGSGFIDELAWLFVPPPPIDCWATDWQKYREEAAAKQIEYFCKTFYWPCFCDLGLFGLSAAEVPDPSAVEKERDIYQPFGVGGQFSPPNDGSSLLGAPVVAPHYSAMIASIRNVSATQMWDWLIDAGPMSPLNNVESLMFPLDASCDADEMQWNALKGSWNLALQTLGWGRYLAESRKEPPILWQAAKSNAFLSEGYELMISVPVTSVQIHGPSWVSDTGQFSATYEPQNAVQPVTIAWDNGTVGTSTQYTWSSPGLYLVEVIAKNRCEVPVADAHSVVNHFVECYLPIIVRR